MNTPWAEKKLTLLSQWAGIDAAFYSRAVFWNGIAYATQVIRGICTTFLLARLLDPVSFGRFRYIIAIYSIAGIFSLPGLHTSISRGVAKGDEIIVKPAMRLMLRGSIVSAILLFCSAAWSSFVAHEQNVAYGLIIAAISIPFCVVGNTYSSVLVGQQKVRTLSLFTIINNLVFAFLFVTALWIKPSFLFTLACFFGIDATLRTILTWRVVRTLTEHGEAKTHLELGKHLSAITIIQGIAYQIDQLLVQWVGGYKTLASYSIAMLIPEQLKDFINSFSSLILARFSQQKASEKTAAAARRHYWTVAGIAAFGVIAYIAVTPFAIPLIFPQYKDAVLPSIIYSIGIIGINTMVGVSYAQAHHHLKQLWRFYTGSIAIQITTNLALIPFFGGWGAVVSKTITRLASMTLIYPKNEPSSLQKDH